MPYQAVSESGWAGPIRETEAEAHDDGEEYISEPGNEDENYEVIAV
tara:strand:- start:430 stop:567 length:138 start_codon:yes stop_codon:yes gene_type:complete